MEKKGKDPQSAEALHALGIASAQSRNYRDAINYLKKAVELDPKNPVLQLHLANALKLESLFSEAEKVLKKIIADHPDYIQAYHNLGTTYFDLGKLEDAIYYYQLAISKAPKYQDAYYNLGLALLKNNNYVEAIKAFQDLLKLQPEHFAGRFHLACALLKDDKIEESLKEFLLIDASHPYHLETQINMATAFLKKGKLVEAKQHYLRALSLAPEDVQILFNLGVVSMQQGIVDSAIRYYQRCVEIDADYFPAYNNLGVAFLTKHQHDFALRYFREALRIQPSNKSLQHIIKVISENQKLLTSPPEYIQTLFDSYAEHYDYHLLQGLNYQVPQILFQAVSKYLTSDLDILDLGCGTGLCGLYFKPNAKKLVGVDLSEKMLAFAKEKNCYDELICAEINTYLANTKDQFDIVIAGDALVYVGDLTDVFSNVSKILKKDGLFLFNAEISAKKEFVLLPTGRFAHQKAWITKLAKTNNLEVLHYQTIVSRLQNNEPLEGQVFVLRRL